MHDPLPGSAASKECDHKPCGACFAERHDGHDVGWRHEDGRLYSATCHDCKETFRAD